ncbi:MAG: four helix bundle protein [Richelia sp. RM2_1_2]|nr:four helix bundle protein [Richelia sp. SM2_1_7]NJM20042.1 four helix bundle protein [Richelia sp. SM1_7_0]NJN09314.1 four helix bundle protein [Richelia sp. RM1_1_1]NJO26980.1 four helix bundle protein [Richelia sp. SL_2_1]NJO59454.1 four helix bundle protein [Richelia sp. RM2_1_2]
MTRPDFEDLRVYQLAEKLANEIWDIVQNWKSFEKDTVGKQIVRSADSICANIAEGRGRFNYQDNRRFIRISRGSLYETICLLRLAYVRKLLTKEQASKLKPIIDKLSPKLNAYLNSIGNKK